MIFVALGTHDQPFDRALDVVLPLAANERLVVQHGHTPARVNERVEWVEFADYDTVVGYMVDARAIVCHAGVGTIMTALGVGKTPVVIPRLARFHEHVDDHQLQITEAFDARGIVVRFADGDDIVERVDQAAAATGTPRRRRGDLVAAVAHAASGAPRQRGRDDLPGVAEPARPPG